VILFDRKPNVRDLASADPELVMAQRLYPSNAIYAMQRQFRDDFDPDYVCEEDEHPTAEEVLESGMWARWYAGDRPIVAAGPLAAASLGLAHLPVPSRAGQVILVPAPADYTQWGGGIGEKSLRLIRYGVGLSA
jgi:hypothetical protein